MVISTRRPSARSPAPSASVRCSSRCGSYSETEEILMPTNGRLTNYINGAWRPAAASEYADVTNPATGEVLARAPLGGEADVNAAVEAAAAAFPEWRRTPPEERIQYLFKL